MLPSMILLALLQATPDPAAARFDACVALTRTDPVAARAEASRWGAAGGRWFARQCAGLAYAAERSWAAAATEFEAAARAAEIARDTRSALYWSQAGNAWLAGGEPAKARVALDAALAGDTLPTFERGEALLDRARALVATDDPGAARADLDRALIAVPEDPLAWLLSATLARRVKDAPRARKDIGEALRRSPDDASVQLEAGNIAALSGDEAGARAAWAQAARLAPNAPAGQQALAALRQFDTGGPAKPALPVGR